MHQVNVNLFAIVRWLYEHCMNTVWTLYAHECQGMYSISNVLEIAGGVYFVMYEYVEVSQNESSSYEEAHSETRDCIA